MPRWPDPFEWPPRGDGPMSGPASKFWEPITNAETLRGNEWRQIAGDSRDSRGFVAFRYPIDLDAILVEFELGPGIEAERGPRPALHYLRGGSSDWGMVSLTAIEGWWQRRRRARWWREWNAAPRPRVLLVNPHQSRE